MWTKDSLGYGSVLLQSTVTLGAFKKRLMFSECVQAVDKSVVSVE